MAAKLNAMRHDRVSLVEPGSLFTRKRFQVAGALIVGALVPWSMRAFLPGNPFDPASTNAMAANCLAVLIAFWMRLSIETYPGIRRSAVILPAAVTGHGVMLVGFLLTRLPYDRVALTVGFILHVIWLYVLYVYADRNVARSIAIVPFGDVEGLSRIDGIRWKVLTRPRLSDTKRVNAIVADFSAELPDEWEAFLADAALAGRIVYQVKQLSESLTGRVELEHLSENSFGSLLPARGYFHLKGLADFLTAVVVLPVALPLMAAVAIAIRLDSRGPAFFLQKRVGHAGRGFTVYKFRTMRVLGKGEAAPSRTEAMTGEEDDRVTRVGRFLRTTRIDELPQIINILKWQMSWIGPRPEAAILSQWYTSEIPFYRYRHVVKPGISGWAQVNQGHVAEVNEVHRKLQYDFYYIKYFSPWLDVLIIFKTIKTMLNGFGAR